MKVTDELFEKYRKLSPFLVNKYFGSYTGYLKDVLISAGYDGIINAIEKYNDEKEVSLNAFIEVCAYRSILAAVRSLVRQKNRQVSFYELKESAQRNLSRNYALPCDVELSERDISNIDKYIENEYNKFIINRALEIINKLSVRERRILSLYLYGKNTVEIARDIGVSRQRISVILHAIQELIKIDKLDNQYNEV